MRTDVTQILGAVRAGDREAAARLLPLVYQELRQLAEHRLSRESPGQTLQATALVHEAYLRLVDPKDPNGSHWDGEVHFFSAAAEAMRRILIDRARARGAQKRGGARKRIALEAIDLLLDPVPPEVLDLDEALEHLAREHPRHAELVKLRFFAGLTLAQAAAALQLPPSTADRHWAFARAWLYRRLNP